MSALVYTGIFLEMVRNTGTNFAQVFYQTLEEMNLQPGVYSSQALKAVGWGKNLLWFLESEGVCETYTCFLHIEHGQKCRTKSYHII